jgi:hypothetical protein
VEEQLSQLQRIDQHLREAFQERCSLGTGKATSKRDLFL